MNEDIEFHNHLNNINNVNAVNFLNNYNYQVPRRKYNIRARIDPLEELDVKDFLQRFRFTKDETREIYDLIWLSANTRAAGKNCNFPLRNKLI